MNLPSTLIRFVGTTFRVNISNFNENDVPEPEREATLLFHKNWENIEFKIVTQRLVINGVEPHHEELYKESFAKLGGIQPDQYEYYRKGK